MKYNRQYSFTNDAGMISADGQLLTKIAAFPEVN